MTPHQITDLLSAAAYLECVGDVVSMPAVEAERIAVTLRELATPTAREAGDAIEREREAPIWREALTLIAGTDPLDAALDPQRLVGLAKQALAATPSPSLRIAGADLKILAAVRREMNEDDSGNAPGHAHQIPGIWDDDNGAKAGKPCAWCLTWAKFTRLINEASAGHPRTPGGKQR